MALINIPTDYQTLKTRLETVVKKILSPKHISENEDLNDYMTIGFYRCNSNSTVSTLSNCPTTTAFGMVVETVGAYDGVRQIITTYNTTPRIYFRTLYYDPYDNNTFKTSGWKIIYEDTGWKDVTFPSGFTHHSDTDRVRYRRVGKVVEVRGAVKNTNQISANSSTHIATISDTTCRPSKRVILRQQGSSLNTYLLSVNTDGRLMAERYGTTSAIAIPASAWLNVHTTFLVD